ncbi:UvrD-helicase domain-containing protein [Photobacterium swingsii]|uniref:UvrD-helicase domain-containing protein n=1 Tax=Photobacterium swingsii TaxID=680026 RepID=UPI004068E14E
MSIAIDNAELAAEQALEQMYDCIRERRHFRLEAGAGAGKTYSLIKGLKLLINEQGETLARKGQQVACITYTNVATNEINARTDGHPIIFASTIHGFCWSLIRDHQLFMWQQLPDLHDSWQSKFDELDDNNPHQREVCYSTGRRRLTEQEAQLSHDDILPLMVKLLAQPKFRRNIQSRFPIIFIDEYQDTDKSFASSLLEFFIEEIAADSLSPLIGFFGDSWQKIYRTGAGLIEHENLNEIGKQANFRSAHNIVDVLNLIRPELPQHSKNSSTDGTVSVFHTNDWVGERQTSAHWRGDLPSIDCHDALNITKERLVEQGWDFTTSETRILMLTHKVMASEQGYESLASVFANNDALFNLEDAHIHFLVKILIPVSRAFDEGQFGEMFSLLGSNAPLMKSGIEKNIWRSNMNELLGLQETGTIGDIIDHLLIVEAPSLPDKIITREGQLREITSEDLQSDRYLQELQKLRAVPFTELVAFEKFIKHYTPFSTKHGVKGAEFDNVLVVLGRGWNLYNWDQFFTWQKNGWPEKKQESMERNRNLFYVACSRPKVNLALLITQELSHDSISTLSNWFGEDNLHSIF